MIHEYCEIADVNSSCCMRKQKSLILYQALDSEFYHLKKQIKIIKKMNIDSEKIRSLINDHSVQIIKSPALTVIPSSANLVNKNNKQKSSQEDQSRDQFNKR